VYGRHTDAVDNRRKFWKACRRGRLSVVRELLALQGDRAPNLAAVKRCGKLYHDMVWGRRRAVLMLRVTAVRATVTRG